MARKTSVSDNGSYPQFCYLASIRDDIFDNFKQHPVYCSIVEHFSTWEIEIGAKYLDNIFNNYSFSDDLWAGFLKNDSLGNPNVAEYVLGDKCLTASPTTLRYIKVLSDILALFDTDNIKKISEIGVGYGGQCHVIMQMFPQITYNLIDLPEVIALTEKYLNKLNHSKKDIRYIDGTHLYFDLPADLFISNYAFSELSKPVQDIYLDKIILKAKAGYITWNYGDQRLNTWDNDGYRLEEVLEKIPNSISIPENPPRTDFNSIILWGTKERK